MKNINIVELSIVEIQIFTEPCECTYSITLTISKDKMPTWKHSMVQGSQMRKSSIEKDVPILKASRLAKNL